MIDMRYWHPLLPIWIFLSVTSWPWMFAIATSMNYGGFNYLVMGTEDVLACGFSVLYAILAVLACAVVHIGFESSVSVFATNALGSQELMERYYLKALSAART